MPDYSVGRFLPAAKAQKLTIYLLLGGIALYLGYDIFAYNNSAGDSISSVSMSEMYFHPAYTMILGALLGHLAWPTNGARSASTCLQYVVPIMVALGLWDHFFPVHHPVWPIWSLLAGIPVGHLLFPQDTAALNTVGRQDAESSPKD